MSAYVVEDATIGRIVGYLYQRAASDRLAPSFMAPLAQPCDGLGYALWADAQRPNGELRATCGRLAAAMHALNVAAVRHRYPDKAEADLFPPQPYTYRQIVGQIVPVAAFKSLQCWLYQCSEGECKQTPLFKAFEAVAASLAVKVVMALPEYNALPWA